MAFVSCGGTDKIIQVLVRKPEKKRSFELSRSRWYDNIKMGFEGILWEDTDWIYMAQDRDNCRALVNMLCYVCYWGKR